MCASGVRPTGWMRPRMSPSGRGPPSIARLSGRRRGCFAGWRSPRRVTGSGSEAGVPFNRKRGSLSGQGNYAALRTGVGHRAGSSRWMTLLCWRQASAHRRRCPPDAPAWATYLDGKSSATTMSCRTLPIPSPARTPASISALRLPASSSPAARLAVDAAEPAWRGTSTSGRITTRRGAWCTAVSTPPPSKPPPASAPAWRGTGGSSRSVCTMRPISCARRCRGRRTSRSRAARKGAIIASSWALQLADHRRPAGRCGPGAGGTSGRGGRRSGLPGPWPGPGSWPASGPSARSARTGPGGARRR